MHKPGGWITPTQFVLMRQERVNSLQAFKSTQAFSLISVAQQIDNSIFFSLGYLEPNPLLSSLTKWYQKILSNFGCTASSLPVPGQQQVGEGNSQQRDNRKANNCTHSVQNRTRARRGLKATQENRGLSLVTFGTPGSQDPGDFPNRTKYLLKLIVSQAIFQTDNTQSWCPSTFLVYFVTYLIHKAPLFEAVVLKFAVALTCPTPQTPRLI